MKRNEIFWLLGIVVFFAIGIFAFPQMPEKMASHGNAAGEVDGYSPKLWGIFLVPLIYAGLVLLFIAIPRIDPLKANIELFRRYYDGLVYVLSVFLLGVCLQTILWNAGVQVSPNVLLPLGLGLLFFYLGILCEHALRNWFVGIRTPWTMSSENVWNKTHRTAAWLFKIAGIIAVLGVFFGRYAVLFAVAPAIAVSVYTLVYSYLEYQKETKQGSK